MRPTVLVALLLTVTLALPACAQVNDKAIADVKAGKTGEFSRNWSPDHEGHFCVQARIDRYVRVPGAAADEQTGRGVASTPVAPVTKPSACSATSMWRVSSLSSTPSSTERPRASAAIGEEAHAQQAPQSSRQPQRDRRGAIPQAQDGLGHKEHEGEQQPRHEAHEQRSPRGKESRAREDRSPTRREASRRKQRLDLTGREPGVEL